jgi:hypothetical protein
MFYHDIPKVSFDLTGDTVPRDRTFLATMSFRVRSEACHARLGLGVGYYETWMNNDEHRLLNRQLHGENMRELVLSYIYTIVCILYNLNKTLAIIHESMIFYNCRWRPFLPTLIWRFRHCEDPRSSLGWQKLSRSATPWLRKPTKKTWESNFGDVVCWDLKGLRELNCGGFHKLLRFAVIQNQNCTKWSCTWTLAHSSNDELYPHVGYVGTNPSYFSSYLVKDG